MIESYRAAESYARSEGTPFTTDPEMVSAVLSDLRAVGICTLPMESDSAACRTLYACCQQWGVDLGSVAAALRYGLRAR